MKVFLSRLSLGAIALISVACAALEDPQNQTAVADLVPRPGTPAVKPVEPEPQEPSVLKTQTGTASWYSIKTNYGTKTASGRPLKNNAKTAAHKTFPLGSKVRVTNKRNGKSEVVTITDRGPYIKGRIIDVTVGCAKRLGFHGRGLAPVKVELLERGKWRYKRPR